MSYVPQFLTFSSGYRKASINHLLPSIFVLALSISRINGAARSLAWRSYERGALLACEQCRPVKIFMRLPDSNISTARPIVPYRQLFRQLALLA